MPYIFLYDNTAKLKLGGILLFFFLSVRLFVWGNNHVYSASSKTLAKSIVDFNCTFSLCVCGSIDFNCAFSLCVCGSIEGNDDSLIFIAVTLSDFKIDVLMYPDHVQSWLDFSHYLLIFLNVVASSLNETGQICNFRAFSCDHRVGMTRNLACWCILSTFRTE